VYVITMHVAQPPADANMCRQINWLKAAATKTNFSLIILNAAEKYQIYNCILTKSLFAPMQCAIFLNADVHEEIRLLQKMRLFVFEVTFAVCKLDGNKFLALGKFSQLLLTCSVAAVCDVRCLTFFYSSPKRRIQNSPWLRDRRNNLRPMLTRLDNFKCHKCQP
jgi:hypothetical protein